MSFPFPQTGSTYNVGGSPLHRYWRIYVTSGVDGNYVSMAEIQMRETVGGSNAISGGTASVSSSAFGTAAADAVDGNASTYWHSDTGFPHWIAYDFGTPKEIVQFAITNRSGFGSQGPLVMALQYSDNGSSWTTKFSITEPALSWNTTQETRLYSASDGLWRIYVSATEDGTYTTIAEIELRATSGGADQATGGQSATNNFGFASPPADAFDNNSATIWHSDGGAFPHHISYRKPSAYSVTEVAIQSRSSNPTRSPKDFKVQYSTDGGANWVDEWSVTNQTGWTNSEQRVFTKP